VIKNGKSRDTGNIGWKTHKEDRQKKKEKKEHTTQKTRKRSNTDTPKTLDLLLKPFTVDSVNIRQQ
jgi:hypothetical protein